MNGISQSLAFSSLGYILITLIGIAVAWWALQQFRFEMFLKNPKSPQAKMLQVLLAIALGYEAGRFLVDYFNWSAMLKGMF